MDPLIICLTIKELHRTPKPDFNCTGIGVAKTKFFEFGVGIVKKYFSESESKKILLGVGVEIGAEKKLFSGSELESKSKKKIFGAGVRFRNQKV